MHTEFVLKNKTSTNKIFKISSIYDLRSAEEHYKDLEFRFIRQGLLDTKNIGRLLKLGAIEPGEFDGIVDFSDFIEDEKFKVFLETATDPIIQIYGKKA